jgi:hypothetical protein
MRVFVYCLCASVVALCCGCSSSEEAGPVIGWKFTTYLPYVESVEYPQTVHVGEDFVVRLHLSSASKPDLLNGLPANIAVLQPGDTAPGFVYNSFSQGELQFTLFTWIVNPSLVGETNDVVEFTTRIHGITAPGERTFQIYSAKTPDKGGMVVSGTFYPPPYHPDGEFKYYPLTVLPAAAE